MGSIRLNEAVYYVVVRRGSDVVAMLAIVKVCLFTITEAFIHYYLLVFRVIRMLGRS
jgi:hypothetical protein